MQTCNSMPLCEFDTPLVGYAHINKLLPVTCNLATTFSIPRHLGNLVEETIPYVGMLAETGINGEYNLLGTAFIVAPNIILAARHTVNFFSIGELCFITNLGQYKQLILLEDGENYNLDYVLFYIVDHGHTLKTYLSLTTEAPVPDSHFFCIGYHEEDESSFIVSKINAGVGQCYNLTIPSNLSSVSGFSGAPYINHKREVFGIHIKSAAVDSITFRERTGFPVLEILRNGSLLSYIIFNKELFNKLTATVSRLDYDFLACFLNCFQGNLIINCYKNDFYYFGKNNLCNRYQNSLMYYFKKFSTANAILQESDESKRSCLFGSTPSLRSLTGNQVLLRYFIKNKARHVQVAKQNELKKYSPLFAEFLAARARSSFSMKKSDNSTGLKKITSLLSNLEGWEVFIEKPTKKEGSKGKILVGECWVSLNEKRTSGARQVAAIDMGHKFGVVDYWMNGAAKWITDERMIHKVKTKPQTYKKNNRKYNNKVRELNGRYEKYKNPAITGYKDNLDLRKTFMKEPKNYQFQWWQLNQADGRVKGRELNYDAPKDCEWSNDKVVDISPINTTS